MEPCLFRHGKTLLQEAVGEGLSDVASMEPCLFRHGKCDLSQRDEPELELQWSHVFSDMVRISDLIPYERTPRKLQWSHVFSDMVSARAAARETSIILGLQWSHVFSDMVRNLSVLTLTPCPKRLQWSHVFSDMVRYLYENPAIRTAVASMEPCLFRHGKCMYRGVTGTCSISFNGAMSFQTW